MRSSARLALLAAFAVVGCRDDRPPTSPAAAPRFDAQADSGPEGAPDFAPDGDVSEEGTVLPRFGDLAVDAAGSFRPNTPIRLTVRAAGRLATRGATMQVLLPDAGDGARGTRRPGPITPHAAWHAALAPGQTLNHQSTVSFPAPGYYRVTLRLAADSSEPTLLDGRWVQNVAEETVWLTVAEQGGRVTAEFPEALNRVAPGRARAARAHGVPRWRGAPGRLTPDTGVVSPQLIPSCEVTDPTCSPPPDQSTTFSGSVLYTNSVNGGSPVARARVVMWDMNGSVVYTGETDQNGRYSAWAPSCPADYLAYYTIGVYTENTYARVYQGGLGTASDVAALNVYGQDCGATALDIGAYRDQQAEAFDNTTRAAIRGREIFNHTADHGQMRVNIRPELSASITHYYYYRTTASDSIVIGGTDIVGPRGVFVAAHEYGHAVQEKALGGIPTDNCGTHTLTDTLTLRCAYSEGFADFYAVATRGTANGPEYDLAIRNNIYLPATNSDGSRREGPVAAMLYDTWVGSQDGGQDITQYGTPATWTNGTGGLQGDLLGKVLRTCKIDQRALAGVTGSLGASWVRADGIDHVIYCLENRIAYETQFCKCATKAGSMVPVVEWHARDMYFAKRRASKQYPTYYDFEKTSLGLFPEPVRLGAGPYTAFRQLWLCDLYGLCGNQDTVFATPGLYTG